ncbi:MAG: KEOPS complex subunit Pcc1 [Candidatus Methanomethylicaceae archaeon]
MDKALTSTLIIETEDPSMAENLYRILIPEVKTTKTKSSKVSIRREGGRLYLEIEANSIASLRALLNSYLRWIGASMDIFVWDQRR